jgi:hypothetical protein
MGNTNRSQLVRRALGTTAAMAVLTLGLVGTAQAQSPTTNAGQVTPHNAACGTNGTNLDPGTGHALTAAQIRSGSSTGCTAVGAAQTGDTLDYFCWTTQTGGAFTWTYLRDTRTGTRGWVRDDLLSGDGSTHFCGF